MDSDRSIRLMRHRRRRPAIRWAYEGKNSSRADEAVLRSKALRSQSRADGGVAGGLVAATSARTAAAGRAAAAASEQSLLPEQLPPPQPDPSLERPFFSGSRSERSRRAATPHRPPCPSPLCYDSRAHTESHLGWKSFRSIAKIAGKRVGLCGLMCSSRQALPPASAQPSILILRLTHHGSRRVVQKRPKARLQNRRVAARVEDELMPQVIDDLGDGIAVLFSNT